MSIMLKLCHNLHSIIVDSKCIMFTLITYHLVFLSSPLNVPLMFVILNYMYKSITSRVELFVKMLLL